MSNNPNSPVYLCEAVDYYKTHVSDIFGYLKINFKYSLMPLKNNWPLKIKQTHFKNQNTII